MSKILVADDEKNIREGIATYLEDEGYFVFTASDGEEALETIENENIDVIISDLRMPQISGEKLLKIVKEKNLEIPFIILTAHGTVDSAVDAMREGAYDFLTKPLDLERLLLIIKRSLNKKESNDDENANLENILIRKDLKYYEKIMGKSLLMQKIFELVIKIAKSNASVLITGESGVGKEIIADAIFDLSNRNAKPDLPAKIKNNENLIFKITLPIGISLKEAEKEIIKQTLFHSKNNKSKCAEILKIGRKTLHNKIIEYHIDQ